MGEGRTEGRTKESKRNDRKYGETLNSLMLLPWRYNIALMAIFFVCAAAIVLPVLLVAIVSFTSKAAISANGFSYFPAEWSLEAYRYLLLTGDTLLRSFGMTLFYVVAGTAMYLFVIAMCAYVIGQKQYFFAKPIAYMIFLPGLFGGGLIPLYILNTRYLHMGDTIWIYLIPTLAGGFSIIMLRTFITTSIPQALFDAARIDGAGHMRVFFAIVLPLSKAGLATMGLLTVVGRWNDWFTGLLYIQTPSLLPVATVLQKIQNQIDFFKKGSVASFTAEGQAMLKNIPVENFRMAVTFVVMLPILFAYPFFQRYFIQGLTMGSVKG
jgi:putative aldouronate transport system permease protein